MQHQTQILNLFIERLIHFKCVQVHKQLWFHIQAHFITRAIHGSKVFKYKQVTFAFSIRTCLKAGQDFNYSGIKSPPFWTSIQNSMLQESFLNLLTCCLLDISISMFLIKILILFNLTQLIFCLISEGWYNQQANFENTNEKAEDCRTVQINKYINKHYANIHICFLR